MSNLYVFTAMRGGVLCAGVIAESEPIAIAKLVEYGAIYEEDVVDGGRCKIQVFELVESCASAVVFFVEE